MAYRGVGVTGGDRVGSPVSCLNLSPWSEAKGPKARLAKALQGYRAWHASMRITWGCSRLWMRPLDSISRYTIRQAIASCAGDGVTRHALQPILPGL